MYSHGPPGMIKAGHSPKIPAGFFGNNSWSSKCRILRQPAIKLRWAHLSIKKGSFLIAPKERNIFSWAWHNQNIITTLLSVTQERNPAGHSSWPPEPLPGLCLPYTTPHFFAFCGADSLQILMKVLLGLLSQCVKELQTLNLFPCHIYSANI